MKQSTTFKDLILHYKLNAKWIKGKIKKSVIQNIDEDNANKNLIEKRLNRIISIQSMSNNLVTQNKKLNYCLKCIDKNEENEANIDKLEKKIELRKEIVDINKNNHKQCEELINARNNILKWIRKERLEKDKLLQKIEKLKYEMNINDALKTEKYHNNNNSNNDFNSKRIENINNNLKQLISNNLSNNSKYSEIDLILEMESREIKQILNELKLNRNVNNKYK